MTAGKRAQAENKKKKNRCCKDIMNLELLL